jgi:hypothetical protein
LANELSRKGRLAEARCHRKELRGGQEENQTRLYETFPVMRFFLELTQHFPPRGCQYIRQYGLYASRTKGKWPGKP